MYEVYFANSRVTKPLSKFPSIIEQRIVESIRKLSQNPRPPRSQKLAGKLKGAWRIRVGDYRILYDVYDEERKVVILEIGHRRDIYR